MQPPSPEGPYSQPPSQYGSYYRPPTSFQGSPEELEALSKGYFALGWVFGANVLLNLIAFGLIFAVQSNDPTENIAPLAFPIAGTFVAIVVGLLTIGPVRNIAYGMRWQKSAVIMWCIGLGLLAGFCCGLIGPAILQSIAAARIKNFGVRAGCLGIRKRDVEMAVAQMRTVAAPPQYPAPQAQYPAPPAQPSAQSVEPPPPTQPFPPEETGEIPPPDDSAGGMQE